MAKNYRDIYEQELNIKLQPGIASIHHIDWNHNNSNIKNLVAIPQSLHDDLNIVISKFPTVLKRVLRSKCYWNIKLKTLKELSSYVTVYEKLHEYISLKNVIKKYGLDTALNIFDKNLIEEIIVLKKESIT